MRASDSGLPWKERRQRPTPAISSYLFRGRRRLPTPGMEENAYVDRPAREAWQSAVLLLCLSILDALFSLRLFADDRFHELNPLLYIGLQHSETAFLIIKFSLTLFAIFVLLIHWNFVIAARQVRVVWLIRTMIGAYGLIVVYEVLLLTH